MSIIWKYTEKMIILPKQFTEANIRILFVCGNLRDVKTIELMSRVSLISTLYYVVRDPQEFLRNAGDFDEDTMPNVVGIDLDENMIENLAFVKKIKRNQMFADCPVLGFTTGADENIMNSAAYRGIDDILIKDDSREALKQNCEIIFTHWFATSEIYFVE